MLKKELVVFFVVILIPILFPDAVFAQLQGKRKMDSLYTVLQQCANDSNKVKLMLCIAKEYAEADPPAGVRMATKAAELAKDLKWQQGIPIAHSMIALNHEYNNDFDSALQFYRLSLKDLETIGDKNGVAKAVFNIAIVYYEQNNFPMALEYNQKAIILFKNTDNEKYISSAYGNIGVIYENSCDYARALAYYFKSLKIDEELNDQASMAINLGNIGNIYNELKNSEKAIEYYSRSLEIKARIGDKRGTAIFTNNIGGVYAHQQKYGMALGYFLSSLKISDVINDKKGVASSYYCIGIALFNAGYYEEAHNCLLFSLISARNIDNKSLTALDLFAIGNLYIDILEKGKNVSIQHNPVNSDSQADSLRKIINEAVVVKLAAALPGSNSAKQRSDILQNKTKLLQEGIRLTNEGLAIFNEIQDASHVEECYRTLVIAYRIAGDNKKALEAYDSLVAIHDSILTNDNKVTIANLSTKREEELKEKQIAINKLEIEKKINERSLFATGLILLLILAAGLVVNLRFVRKSRQELRHEKDVSESLLLNILPSDVAEELKASGAAKARHFNDVTVLFTDFVGFTTVSERRTPQELVDELHHCFKAFDGIVSKYGIEKIKTVGDAYLAVAGLPVPTTHHALNTVKAAIEIRDFMVQRYQQLGEKSFQVRIGVNSGSVVAGIVGVKKFAYDIWGDTVNTAARMEQNGVAGKVNISESTYTLVNEEFACEYRGEIDAKNKGKLKMYFVE